MTYYISFKVPDSNYFKVFVKSAVVALYSMCISSCGCVPVDQPTGHCFPMPVISLFESAFCYLSRNYYILHIASYPFGGITAYCP